MLPPPSTKDSNHLLKADAGEQGEGEGGQIAEGRQPAHGLYRQRMKEEDCHDHRDPTTPRPLITVVGIP